jgi:type III secretion protein R
MGKNPPPPPTERTRVQSWLQHPWVRRTLALALACLPFLLMAGDTLAQRKPMTPDFTQGLTGNPLQLIIILGSMALAPFLLMMITSFVKIAVVLSIIRSALGTQQNPPTQVITGLAIILTVYVMAPVGLEIHTNIKPHLEEWRNGTQTNNRRQKRKSLFMDMESAKLLDKILGGVGGPVKRFLKEHSHVKERNMFYNLALQLQRAQELKQQRDLKREGNDQKVTKRKVGLDDFIVLIPSFVISELKEAFQIGFLIFLPFIIVDMVVANILLALGMHMLSPTTISLPFKLLLFVLVDGWYLITKGLILGYI